MTGTEYRHIAYAMHDGIAVLTIQESHLREAPTCFAVRDEMLAALKPAAPTNLLVDLRQVEFIGSIGFLVFLGLRRELADSRVILCSLSPAIHEAFRVCRLISTDPNTAGPFEVASSVEAGAERVRS